MSHFKKIGQIVKTRRVHNEVPNKILEQLVFRTLDLAQIQDLDYLMVYEFSEDTDHSQKMIMRCEQPEFHSEVSIPIETLGLEEAYTGKLFFIDDETVQTILFPSDY